MFTMDFDEDLPTISANEILEPLREANMSIRKRLEARVHAYHSPDNLHWWTVFVMVLASADTMFGSLFLVADARLKEKEAGTGPGPFPAQAIMVQRGQLEALGNLMAVLENPPTRAVLFHRDGYREQINAVKKFKASHTGPRWEAFFARAEAGLRQQARMLKLSPTEAADGSGLKSWPLPKGLKEGKDQFGQRWLTGNRLQVFQILYEDSYGPDSLVAHQKHAALHFAWRRHKGIDEDELMKLRSISALRAANYHCALLTEVESAMSWSGSSAMPQLRAVWKLLVQGFDISADIYRSRYKDLVEGA
jgi:hypothetical protein